MNNNIVSLELKLKTGDILVINGKRYLVGEWTIGDGFNLTGIEHLYEEKIK